MDGIENGSDEEVGTAPLMDPLIISERRRYQRRKEKKERKLQRRLQRQLQQALATSEQLTSQLNEINDQGNLLIEDSKPQVKPKKLSKKKKRTAEPKPNDTASKRKKSVAKSIQANESPVEINHGDPKPAVCYPKVAYCSPNATTECKGCGMQFNCYKTPSSGMLTYPTEYYDHCILECDEYKALDLIRQCEQCSLLFLNARNLSIHRSKAHKKPPKPNWLSQIQYDTAYTVTFNSNTTKNCEGCGQKFKGKSYDKFPEKGVIPELAYYIHVVEQCAKYKELGLLKSCKECEFIFTNENSYAGHVKLHNREPKPLWMGDVTFKQTKKVDKYANTFRPCQACGKPFKAIVTQLKHKESIQYELDYYIHVVEMCDKFKELDLLRKCEPCGLIFTSQIAFTKHRTTHNEEAPLKPEWMTEAIFKIANRATLHNDCERPCEGCGELFKAKSYRTKTGVRIHFELTYYIHVIENCKRYKALNLIQSCDICKCKFINLTALKHHKCII